MTCYGTHPRRPLGPMCCVEDFSGYATSAANFDTLGIAEISHRMDRRSRAG